MPNNEQADYTDPKTDKPLKFADDIPKEAHKQLFDLLQPLTPKEEQSVSGYDELFKQGPKELAEKGANPWNLWVRAHHKIWVQVDPVDDYILVSLKGPEEIAADRTLFPNGAAKIVFGKTNQQDHIAVKRFSNFIFPAEVSFKQCIFSNSASFGSTVFLGAVDFSHAHWGDTAVFDKALFCQDATFATVKFLKNSQFSDVVFCGKASFKGNAQFRGYAWMQNMHFKGEATFEDAIFEDRADFFGSRFYSKVSFVDAQIKQDAVFSDAHFEGEARFKKTKFNGGWNSFGNAVFKAAARFNNAIIDGDFDLDSAVFHETAYFQNINCNVLNVRDALFFGDVFWHETEFLKAADFSGTCFLGNVRFPNVKFKNGVDFDHVHFGKSNETKLPEQIDADKSWAQEVIDEFNNAPFVGTESKTVPDFKSTEFSVVPNLGYTDVAEIPQKPAANAWQRLRRFWGAGVENYRIEDEDAAAKLRRLGELANQGHHQLAEKRFFRNELLCRRGHEATSWREVTMINLFELFSKCGLSFWKPIGWLGLLAVLCGVFYGVETGRTLSEMQGVWFELVSFTFLNSLPLIGYASDGYGIAAEFLYGGKATLPHGVRAVTVVQNMLSALYLFFAFLAVRNYFKLG